MKKNRLKNFFKRKKGKPSDPPEDEEDSKLGEASSSVQPTTKSGHDSKTQQVTCPEDTSIPVYAEPWQTDKKKSNPALKTTNAFEGEGEYEMIDDKKESVGKTAPGPSVSAKENKFKSYHEECCLYDAIDDDMLHEHLKNADNIKDESDNKNDLPVYAKPDRKGKKKKNKPTSPVYDKETPIERKQDAETGGNLYDVPDEADQYTTIPDADIRECDGNDDDSKLQLYAQPLPLSKRPGKVEKDTAATNDTPTNLVRKQHVEKRNSDSEGRGKISASSPNDKGTVLKQELAKTQSDPWKSTAGQQKVAVKKTETKTSSSNVSHTLQSSHLATAKCEKMLPSVGEDASYWDTHGLTISQDEVGTTKTNVSSEHRIAVKTPPCRSQEDNEVLQSECSPSTCDAVILAPSDKDNTLYHEPERVKSALVEDEEDFYDEDHIYVNQDYLINCGKTASYINVQSDPVKLEEDARILEDDELYYNIAPRRKDLVITKDEDLYSDTTDMTPQLMSNLEVGHTQNQQHACDEYDDDADGYATTHVVYQ